VTKARALTPLAAGLLCWPALAAEPVILTNHLGYELNGPKHAVVQGTRGDEIRSCAVEDIDTAAKTPTETPRSVGPVAKWRDWVYWTVEFSKLQRAGTFRLICASAEGPLLSFPFRIERDLLERRTLSDVVYYFKGQRSSGLLDAADRRLPFERREDRHVDAHGGWYDATGDYGKHLSHLSFSTYFNPQQLPLSTWGLLETYELLQRRSDPMFKQYLRRILDEAAWGADYLVRVKAPGGSFYRSVSGPGPGKRPEDRRVGRDAKGVAIKATKDQAGSVQREAALTDEFTYQSSLRAGGGIAIAALARAAALSVPGERGDDYLLVAEEAWAFLAANNPALTNDGQENIVDDYCALLAATELYMTTRKAEYKAAADARAASLLPPRTARRWRAITTSFRSR